MQRTQLIRGLRIAWTVWWSTACVLLIFVWMRSYWKVDYMCHYKPGGVRIAVWNGGLQFDTNSSRYGNGERVWMFSGRTGFAPMIHERPVLGFVWSRTASHWIAVVPFWFLTLLSAAMASAPWIRWSKTFSLRTLFIAPTLVAVLFGLAAWSMK